MVNAIAFRKNLITGLFVLLLAGFGVPNDGLADLNQNLLAHWNFDEGSGTVLHDVAGAEHTHNGTIYGNPQWVDGVGVSGYALEFDGNGDYVEITEHIADFEFVNQSVSFSSWVQIVDNADIYRHFVCLADADEYPAITLAKARSGLWNGRIYMEVHTGISHHALSIDDGTTLPKDTWMFVTGVVDYESHLVKLYINGVFQDDESLGNFDMSQAQNLKLRLGWNAWGQTHYHKGLMDEVRIYDRALSEEEIEELYEMHAPPPEPFYFIHITDPHVGTTGAAERFEYVINEINGLSPPPQFVIISGDLVHLGLHELYWVTFLSLIGELNVPCYVCVGNHDNLLFPWWLQPWSIPLIPLFSDYDGCPTRNLHLISMNSGGYADWFEGWVWVWINWAPFLVPILDWIPEGTGFSDAQWQWLLGVIDDHPGYNKILFMHHPVVCKTSSYQFEGEEESNGCITNHRSDIMNLCRSEEVKVVLGGHIHSDYEYRANIDNTPFELTTTSGDGYSLGSPVGYWSSYTVPDFPMYIITSACGQSLAYRRVEIDGDEVRVWQEQNFKADNDLASYHMDMIPLPWPGNKLQSMNGIAADLAPGRLHVYDSYGNHMGVNDIGGVDFEIAGAYYEDEPVPIDTTTDTLFWTSGELISLVLNPFESYTYKLEISVECTLNVSGHFIKKKAGGEISTIYSNIEADSGSLGQLFINNEIIDYTLYMDDDGDGTVDREILPDTIIAMLRGDASGDGIIDLGDVLHLINYLYKGGPAPDPLWTGDVNCDGVIDLGDLLYLINYLYKGGPAPGC